ncbi:MAG: hypothetical protein ACRYFB_14720 [Janthinobacterium lividum]
MQTVKCKDSLHILLFLTVLGITICSYLPALAQKEAQLQDSLKNKLNIYRQIHPSTTLFAHFDKTIYTNNENVWFTAYLLNTTQLNQHSVLAVSLVNDIDHSIISQQKFVMADGIGFGNVFLPDSVAPGNYTFMLSTNRLNNKQPEAVFTQPITVKNTNTTDFTATLTIADSSNYDKAKPQKVTLSVIGSNYLPVANAAINYQITGKNGITLSGKSKTDKAGTYIFVLPPNENQVNVQVQNNKTSKYIHLILPERQKQIWVNFYPEGGGLVNGLISVVGWEVKTSANLPLMVTGVLLKNDIPVDTITTDSYGIGKFALMPQAGSKYSVKLLNRPDTAYHLPIARTTGLVMMTGKSITNDTLKVRLQSSYDTNVFLNVHNYHELFFTKMIPLKAVQPRTVTVVLTGLPKGLAEITLTDSLGHPYAERLFFAHYDQRDLLGLQTEKQQYHTREKVNLKLKLQATDTTKIKGFVSVACVQDNRLEIKKLSDIESYVYLQHDLGDLPLKENYMGKSSIDKIYLENMLLVKGWRNYTWPDLLTAKGRDTVIITSSPAFTGHVTYGNKPIKKQTFVVVLSDSTSHIITTSANGDFKVADDYLVAEQDKKVNFLIQNTGIYTLSLTDPFTSIHKTLAQQFRNQNFESATSYSQNTETMNMKGFERAIQLKGVTIRAIKDNAVYKSSDYGSNSNACGDYVCRFGVLNCPNHRHEADNRPPIQGGMYAINGRLEVYSGCSVPEKKVNYSMDGIYRAKQFYGSDYSMVNDPTPDYVSTIYWKHLVLLDSSKEAELSFYTSDITGKFRIIVQGITSDDVVYSEIFLNVQKP